MFRLHAESLKHCAVPFSYNNNFLDNFMFEFTLLFCLFKVYLSFFILFSLIVAATIKHDQSFKGQCMYK